MSEARWGGQPPADLVPENAPFDEEQRAWLNGFLAGLLGLGNGEARAALDPAQRPPAADNDASNSGPSGQGASGPVAGGQLPVSPVVGGPIAGGRASPSRATLSRVAISRAARRCEPPSRTATCTIRWAIHREAMPLSLTSPVPSPRPHRDATVVWVRRVSDRRVRSRRSGPPKRTTSMGTRRRQRRPGSAPTPHAAREAIAPGHWVARHVARCEVRRGERPQPSRARARVSSAPGASPARHTACASNRKGS